MLPVLLASGGHGAEAGRRRREYILQVLKTRLWLMEEPQCPGLRRVDQGPPSPPSEPLLPASLERCIYGLDVPHALTYKE